jgi:hypothetical protein
MAFKGRKYDGEASAMGENDSRKASTMKVKRQRKVEHYRTVQCKEEHKHTQAQRGTPPVANDDFFIFTLF